MRAFPLYSGNHEPSVEEMLDDPIVGLVMRRDSVTPDEVRGVMDEASRRRGRGYDKRRLPDSWSIREPEKA
jgi:hypothetical protein